jgi:hypothetical protein
VPIRSGERDGRPRPGREHADATLAQLGSCPGRPRRPGHHAGRASCRKAGDLRHHRRHPYGQPQIDNFPNDVAEINADPDVRLVVHLGDIKNGPSLRDTAYFQQIRAGFDQFEDPLVYTPGDNEWTDCHRPSNGGYTPTERLDTLRQVFFDRPGWSLGQHPRGLRAQHPAHVENVPWW